VQTALVSGANRGIGLALAREFLRHDDRVVAGSRRPEAASDLQRLSSDPERLIVTQLDVDDDGSIKRVAREVSERCGQLDLLVNNAGVFPEDGYEAFEELNPEWFADAFRTNVVGVARMCREFLPLLRKGRNPRIVNISSGAGSISTKEDSRYYCYSVSKAALNMLTRALANELRKEGVIVVAISPGWVSTEMGGPKAPITPETSARSLVRTMSGLSLDVSGAFLNRDGEKGEYRW